MITISQTNYSGALNCRLPQKLPAASRTPTARHALSLQTPLRIPPFGASLQTAPGSPRDHQDSCLPDTTYTLSVCGQGCSCSLFSVLLYQKSLKVLGFLKFCTYKRVGSAPDESSQQGCCLRAPSADAGEASSLLFHHQTSPKFG